MPVGGSGADFGVLDGDGLVVVVDVGVNREFVALMLKGLEGDELGAVLDGTGVEGEGHLDGAIGGLGREGGLCGDGLAVHLKRLLGHVALVVGPLHMERAGDGVLLAGDEALVGHGVHDGGLVVGGHAFVTVNTVGGGGADFGSDDVELLVYVVFVLVIGDEVYVEAVAVDAVKLLIDRDGLAAQLVGGERHLHDLVARGSLCREVLGRCDRLVAHGDGIAGRSVDDRGHETVLVVHDEAVVGDLVRDDHVTDVDVAVAVHRVVGMGGDGALRHVVKRAEVVGHAVAGDDDGGVDELVALVARAAQLLNGVGVIGKRAEGVVRLGHSEPDTGGRVQLGAVDGLVGSGIQRPVVAVGVLRVLVPRRGGVEVAVLVGHDDMALAGGLGGHLEGDVRETVCAVVCLLVELKVGALDLIVDVSVHRVYDFPVLGDGELVDGAVGEVVTLPGLDLLQRVVAIGERVVRRGRVAVLDSQGLHDIALGVGDTVHDDRVGAERLDLELGAVDGCTAQRRISTATRKAALGIALVDLDAAARNVVGRGEAVHLPVLGDGDAHVVGGVEIGVVCRALADDVAAVGEGVVRGAGIAVLVGGDGHDGLALGVLLAVHHDGVVVVVDDGEGDAIKGGTALRSLAGLGIDLLHRHAASDGALRHLDRVVGDDRAYGVFLNLLEAHLIVQGVALGCLGLIDDNSATRKCCFSIVGVV